MANYVITQIIAAPFLIFVCNICDTVLCKGSHNDHTNDKTGCDGIVNF